MGNLILSRRNGERVMVGDFLTVTVLEIRGDKVKLGFEADESIQIHREEVRQKIDAARAAKIEDELEDALRAVAEAATDAPE